MKKTDLIMFAKDRALMYRFLGELYLMEVDAAQLGAMKKMVFQDTSEEVDPDLREGFVLMGKAVSGMSEDDLDDLAADYAKTFLAAGDATGRAAFPYESVYVDKKHRVGGSTEMQMHALYKARGREADPQMYRTMDDHIGLILEYQGLLCEELEEALKKEEQEKVVSLLKEQKELLTSHLTNWVFAFSEDVLRYAERDFYKAVALITRGFLKQEKNLLSEGSGAWAIE